MGPGVVCAALCVSFTLPPVAFAQEVPQPEGQEATSGLLLARRLSAPSLGAANYTQQVKQALIALSQEYPEVQTDRKSVV